MRDGAGAAAGAGAGRGRSRSSSSGLPAGAGEAAGGAPAVGRRAARPRCRRGSRRRRTGRSATSGRRRRRREGRARLEEYRRLKAEVARLEAEAEEVGEALRAAGSRWRRRRSCSRPRTASRRRGERLVEAAAAVVATLERGARLRGRATPTARELLADYYWDRFLEAEAARRRGATRVLRRAGRAVPRRQVRARARRATARSTLDVGPAGAEVWLYELVEEGSVLVRARTRAGSGRRRSRRLRSRWGATSWC